MIAFDSASDALEWALLVQEVLLEVNWSKEVGVNRTKEGGGWMRSTGAGGG